MASNAASKASTKSGGPWNLIVRWVTKTELSTQLVSLVGTTHLSAESGCPQIESIDCGACSSWGSKVGADSPFAGLNLSLSSLELLLLLKLLLHMCLSNEFHLILLSLKSLHPHHLKL